MKSPPGKNYNTKPVHRTDAAKTIVEELDFNSCSLPPIPLLCNLKLVVNQKPKHNNTKTLSVPHHVRNPHLVIALGTNFCTQEYACFVVKYAEIYTLALYTCIYYAYIFSFPQEMVKNTHFHGQMGFHGQITFFMATWFSWAQVFHE